VAAGRERIVDSLALTCEFHPRSGSAVDPLVGEVTWAAWEMTAADPARVDDTVLRAVTASFDRIVETGWRPGRSVAISEVDWDPAGPKLGVRLALGCLGEAGCSAPDSAAWAVLVEELLERGPFEGRRVDPSLVLGGAAAGPSGHVALVRQRVWTAGDSHQLVEVVSRFHPTVEPWSAVTRICARSAQAVKVRVSVLATELSPSDRISLEEALVGVAEIRDRNASRADVVFDAGRAEATLLDLRASFASPLLVGELAVSSPSPLPEVFLRSIAAAFTSEADVLRHQGHVVVAANRIVLGGFDIERDPPGWAEAARLGVPLRGGLVGRDLRDVITLTESPIGWPVPTGGPLPGIGSRIASRRSPARTPVAVSASTRLGIDPAGSPIRHPLDRRTRHIAVVGAWGAGKSTAMFNVCLDDLRAGRRFVWVDPHGTTAELLAGWADHLGVETVIVDAADAAGKRIRILDRLDGSLESLERAESQARRLGDAIASSLPSPEWTGPRFFTGWQALCLLAAAHGAELIDVVTWAADPATLKARLDVDHLPALARSTLSGLASTSDGRDVLGWVTSKAHPLVSAAARRLFAAAGGGVELSTAIRSGVPVIANLASLTRGEVSFAGHLLLDTALAATMETPEPDRVLTCYVDEAGRFPAKSLAAAVAEGRKFGLSVCVAVQALSQLPAELTDLVAAADTHILLRSTPDTAARMSPLVGVDPGELVGLPDLHALYCCRGEQPVALRLDRIQTPPAVYLKQPPRRLEPPISARPTRADLVRPARPDPTVIHGPADRAGSEPGFLEIWRARRDHTCPPDTRRDTPLKESTAP